VANGLSGGSGFVGSCPGTPRMQAPTANPCSGAASLCVLSVLLFRKDEKGQIIQTKKSEQQMHRRLVSDVLSKNPSRKRKSTPGRAKAIPPGSGRSTFFSTSNCRHPRGSEEQNHFRLKVGTGRWRSHVFRVVGLKIALLKSMPLRRPQSRAKVFLPSSSGRGF
jgi:hypothetical protein